MTRTALVETFAGLPVEFTRGAGSRLTASDGREYWDFYGGHAVCLLGHAHPDVTRAVADQAARLTFYSNAVPLEIRRRAADRLVAFAGDHLTKVFFCNSGAEANENALKLALKLTGRARIAALAGAFHGRTLLALSATDGDKLRGPYRGVLCERALLRPNDPDDLAGLDHSIAAVIVEPVQSLAGIVELSDDYLTALRRRCNAVGAMLIYDEVQTGMGRLGTPFVAGRGGAWPDLVTSAKGIANGIPMGAVLMSEAVAAQVRPGDLGSTFGGGPVACAAMLAVLDAIERGGLLDTARRLGDRMRSRLRVGPVEAVRGRGCLIGLQTRPPARQVHALLLERGFVTGTSDHPQVLRLMPPINMPDEAVDALADALAGLGNP